MHFVDREQIERDIEEGERLDAQLAAKKLSHFTQTLWNVIEPNVPYMHGYHIDAICDHLEAVKNFEISRLMINVPPRHMKSIALAVMFPAWVWSDPELAHRRFLYVSYSYALSVRDSMKCRNVLASDKYRRLFSPEWRLKEDNNQKHLFENTKTGFRFATSIGGTVTGEGGDYLVGDDILSAQDAQSQAARNEAWEFWSKAFSTRANNPARCARVLIMQRLHEDDPCGRLLKEAEKRGIDIEDGTEYERLILPAEYCPKIVSYSKTSLGYKDPRKEPGELLWPERFDKRAINILKTDLGSAGAEAQLNQDPKPIDGGLFKLEWWPRYKGAPDIVDTFQFWDCAQKPGISNDFSVCATWVTTPNGYAIINVWRGKTDGPLLESMAVAQYELFKPKAVIIEDKSAGSSLIQFLLAGTRMPVLPYNPTKDKQVRASAATPTVQAKKVALPEYAEWLDEFLKEHERFPFASHDDQVDTTSMAVEYFKENLGIAPRVRRL